MREGMIVWRKTEGIRNRLEYIRMWDI